MFKPKITASGDPRGYVSIRNLNKEYNRKDEDHNTMDKNDNLMDEYIFSHVNEP
jgi:hypothetical protein